MFGESAIPWARELGNAVVAYTGVGATSMPASSSTGLRPNPGTDNSTTSPLPSSSTPAGRQGRTSPQPTGPPGASAPSFSTPHAACSLRVAPAPARTAPPSPPPAPQSRNRLHISSLRAGGLGYFPCIRNGRVARCLSRVPVVPQPPPCPRTALPAAPSSGGCDGPAAGFAVKPETWETRC